MSESIAKIKWTKNKAKIDELTAQRTECEKNVGRLNREIGKLVMVGNRLAGLVLTNGETLP